MNPQTPFPPNFINKKGKILSHLAVPISEYDDLSPKGSIDEGIHVLIDEINSCEGFVTTSSCAGRISVFAEGDKNIKTDEPSLISYGNEIHVVKPAGIGGKGGGGKWLFVSHDPVDLKCFQENDNPDFGSFLGMKSHSPGENSSTEFSSNSKDRLVHFKFEPMILHILTASLPHAQVILSAALQAGFRESGAHNLTPASTGSATPMVAIRSMGLALESIIGRQSLAGEWECIVPGRYLLMLLQTSNKRFEENTARISRFRELLITGLATSIDCGPKLKADGSEWEDAVARRKRNRADGLKRSQELKQDKVNMND